MKASISSIWDEKKYLEPILFLEKKIVMLKLVAPTPELAWQLAWQKNHLT